MKGIVFDIQRFSVHDGPGIRTTVFMKGCPLRCAWCHNPEGLTGEPQLQYFADKCIGCGSCGKNKQFTDAEKCPAGALKVCGKVMDEEEVFREIQKDRIFYADNGGVTFSGGECLLQADFVAAVLGRAKEAGLHTAIDTAGYVHWLDIQKTLDCCDLYLYDIKCMDPSLHKAYTGVDNTRILENLRRLSETGKNIWIRIPVIPGFNDCSEEMTAIADFVITLSSVKQITLMSYHTLGASKYETLGLTYSFDINRKISEDVFASIQDIFRKRNLNLV